MKLLTRLTKWDAGLGSKTDRPSDSRGLGAPAGERRVYSLLGLYKGDSMTIFRRPSADSRTSKILFNERISKQWFRTRPGFRWTTLIIRNSLKSRRPKGRTGNSSREYEELTGASNADGPSGIPPGWR